MLTKYERITAIAVMTFSVIFWGTILYLTYKALS